MKELVRLEDIYARFPTKEKCVAFIEGIRWNHKPRCPHCGSDRISPMKNQFRHHCNSCNTSFSVTVKTLFHNTRLPLQKWLTAIALYDHAGRNLTVRRLAEILEVNKNTAWAMLNRLQEARRDYGALLSQLSAKLDGMMPAGV